MTTVAVHAQTAPAPSRPPAPVPAERPRAPSPAPTAPWSAGTVAVAAPAATEDSWLMEGIRSAARSLPGYSLASAALGQDLLTGQAVSRTVGETLETLLSAAGPFGAGVGTVLGVLDILGEAVQAVQRAFAEHRVSFARIARDLGAAWERVDVFLGLEANLDIVAGYVEAFLADVRTAIRRIIDVLLQAVRTAVVPLLEPLLADPAVAPVWSLATKILGVNPLTGQTVEAPTVEVLADFLTLIGQGEAVEQMRERGTLQQTADWLDTQFERFQGLTAQATALFSDAWDAISPQNLPQLLQTLPALAHRAVDLFREVADFATTVAGQVLVFVKDSLLGMISDHAGQVPGFRLLTVILGRDPFTQAPVPRTAEGLIGGFIELLPGGQETYRQLSETGVIAEAASRIESEMVRLEISWELITGTFRAIWDQMSLADLLDPIAAISRVIEQFGEPLGRILSFVATVVQVVIELVLRLMNFPSELLAGIIAGVVAAVEDIKRDPVGFLMHLLEALKSGFQRFFDHILTHLLAGLAGWLFRGLRSLGIEPPTELSGAAILETVLQVLGLTEDFLWERLAAAVGQERVDQIRGALDTMGQAWSFLQDVQERGLAAVWDLVAEQLSGLWETILSAAQDWLMTNLIQAAITKVLSMLDPTGVMAVVNSAIAFFRAVQSVIDYITELLQIIKTYVDTLAAIARGEIEPGAAMLEQGLANAIPVAIGFLAHQMGLSNVPEKIVEIIGRLRALVTRAIDWLIAQALRIGAAALRALSGGDDGAAAGAAPAGTVTGGIPIPAEREPLSMAGDRHTMWFERQGGDVRVFMASDQPGWIVAKINAALADPDCPEDARPFLQRVLEAVRTLETDVEETMRLYTHNHRLDSRLLNAMNLDRDEYQQRVSARLAVIRVALESLGRDVGLRGLTDLGHRSRFVVEDSIAPQYRSDSTWRREFYGGWQGGVDEPFRRRAYHEGEVYWRQQNPGLMLPAGFDLFHCSECGGYFSHRGRVPGFAQRVLTVDHRIPVVTHFTRPGGGLTMVQPERVTWYNDPGNLEPMCGTCNQESIRVTDWRVSRRFRGRNDAAPDPGD